MWGAGGRVRSLPSPAKTSASSSEWSRSLTNNDRFFSGGSVGIDTDAIRDLTNDDTPHCTYMKLTYMRLTYTSAYRGTSLIRKSTPLDPTVGICLGS